MRPDVVVVDLDGTLCNSSARDHLAQAKLWDEFHSALSGDAPWPDVRQMVALLGAVGDHMIVGLTGRNERYRMATQGWFDKHDILIDLLLMRPNDNWEPDHELKPRMLAEAVDQDRVWFILEDRDKVVEAWRNLGYNCWQPRLGSY